MEAIVGTLAKSSVLAHHASFEQIMCMTCIAIVSKRRKRGDSKCDGVRLLPADGIVVVKEEGRESTITLIEGYPRTISTLNHRVS